LRNSKVYDKMIQMWPSNNGKHEKFWRHEYCKHGTCAADIMPKLVDYFRDTLLLHEDFNIKEALEREGVTPSLTETYHFGRLDTALRNAFEVRHEYKCDTMKGGINNLKEIITCFDSNYEAVDCPCRGKFECRREHGVSTSCNLEREFHYRPFVAEDQKKRKFSVSDDRSIDFTDSDDSSNGESSIVFESEDHAEDHSWRWHGEF